MTTDITGAAILISLLLLVLGVGEAWARLGNPAPESSRKFVHLFSGAVCLFFPVLVDSPLVVGALALSMSAFFAFASYFQLLKSLHRVDRSRTSRGSEYYPLAIFLVFLLTGDELWIYFSSVLILGVADAFAALIGTRYGRLRYQVQQGTKSLEGSLAFFAISMLAVILPALFFAELPQANIIQIAFSCALILTGFEAISSGGTDNLFVPVAAAFILPKLAIDTYPVLLFQNAHMVAIFIFLALINAVIPSLNAARKKPFDTGGIITFSLFCYAAWALGSAFWAIPVFTGFLLAIAAWLIAAKKTGVYLSIPIRPTYRALLFPFGILILANISGDYPAYFGPALACTAAVTAFTITTFWRPDPEVRGPLYSTRFATAVGLFSGLSITLPVFAFLPGVGLLSGPFTISLFTAALSALNLRIIERRKRNNDGDEYFWPTSQILLPLLAAALIFGAQTLDIIAPWTPPPEVELMRYWWRPPSS